LVVDGHHAGDKAERRWNGLSPTVLDGERERERERERNGSFLWKLPIYKMYIYIYIINFK
jgi:hypothetical protein